MTALAIGARPANWSQVEAAGHGDMDAFALLYSTYRARVQQFIYRRTGSRVLAEDLTADVFVRALKRIRTVEWRGADFGAWLTTIARNLIADHYKSARHRRDILIDTGLTTQDEQLPAGFDRYIQGEDLVATSVESYLRSVTVLTAVNQLNAAQRECITLRFIRGLTIVETAAVLNLNDGAVKALTWRAIRNLRVLLAGAEL